MTPGRVERLERYEEYGGSSMPVDQRGAWPGYRRIGQAGINVYLGVCSDMPD
jgi:hypothetical protein